MKKREEISLVYGPRIQIFGLTEKRMVRLELVMRDDILVDLFTQW